MRGAGAHVNYLAHVAGPAYGLPAGPATGLAPRPRRHVARYRAGHGRALNALRLEESLPPLDYAPGARRWCRTAPSPSCAWGFLRRTAPSSSGCGSAFSRSIPCASRARHRLFPGSTACSRARAPGIHWGIVTNKPGCLTEPLLAALGLDRRASCVVSGDTLAERKPHPMPLLHAAGAGRRAPATASTSAMRSGTSRPAAPPACYRGRAYGYISGGRRPGGLAADGVIE